MTPSIAYLCSQYPAVSHTFVLREIQALRKLGFTIATASINTPDRQESSLDPEELKEATNTFYVKRDALKHLFPALLQALGHPIGLCRALYEVLSLSRFDIRKFAKNLAYLAEAAIISDWMKREKITHLHVHFANAAATVALLTSKLSPITYSITAHGPDIFFDAYENHLCRKFTNARFVSCISDFCRSQLMLLTPEASWDQYVTCRLGVEIKPKLETKRANPPSIPTILCVGRLVAAKGQSILLEALSLLNKEGVKVNAVLVGDGPCRNSLMVQSRELGLSGSVVFAGSQAPDKIPDFLANASLFVLPSFAEGIPVSLMEAMAAGVPCISTHVNGIPELIRNERDGLLVTPADVGGLAEAIRRLLTSNELSGDLARSAQERVANQYNLTSNISAFSKVLVERMIQQ